MVNDKNDKDLTEGRDKREGMITKEYDDST